VIARIVHREDGGELRGRGHCPSPAQASTQGILDFNVDLDIGLLDRIVNAMFTGAGAEVRAH
jgi:hypothetical protein